MFVPCHRVIGASDS
ncbi:MAG: hypothetical protein ACLRZH_07555 [Ruthenibacterium lactatiformans]